MHHLHGARRIAGVALLLSLCACSSGGGEANKTSRQLELSTNSISFIAAAPTAATPEAQVVTATFSQGLVNLSVMFNGRAIGTVTSSVNGNTAQITVTPAAPGTLGGGEFTSTIAVTGYYCADPACSRLEAGASQNVSAVYQVFPTVNNIAPYVATAGVSDTAIIRGSGFAGFTIQGVEFGNVAATDFTLVSDNEIRVTYPALPAGSYPVTIDVPLRQGAVTTDAKLVVVDPVNFAPQALALPSTGGAVRSLIYDPERSALLVATDANGGSLLRYPYDAGAWSAPSQLAIANIQDAKLSNDGAQLLSLSPTQLIPVDPATLAPTTGIDAPTLPTGTTLKGLAVINVNSAIITTTAGNTASQLYAYVVSTRAMTQLTTALISATPAVSANGAVAILIQGDPATTTSQTVYSLLASNVNFSATPVALNQNSIAPVLDRVVTRVVLNGTYVYDTSMSRQGTLPATTLALVLRPDGQRAYTYDSAAGGLLRFDISAAAPSNGDYPQLGDVVPLAGAPGDGVKMTISPDGNTLFLAGSNQIVIQPTPADP